jgi:hypothetical protein
MVRPMIARSQLQRSCCGFVDIQASAPGHAGPLLTADLCSHGPGGWTRRQRQRRRPCHDPQRPPGRRSRGLTPWNSEVARAGLPDVPRLANFVDTLWIMLAVLGIGALAALALKERAPTDGED